MLSRLCYLDHMRYDMYKVQTVTFKNFWNSENLLVNLIANLGFIHFVLFTDTKSSTALQIGKLTCRLSIFSMFFFFNKFQNNATAVVNVKLGL